MLVDPKWVRIGSMMTGAVMVKGLLIFAGFWLGTWLDQKLGTRPLFLTLGLVAGIAVGLWWIVYVAKRAK
ncbi:MAG: AtpZ/AtpI family protein [Deltaproteobacteria bacterium]|nr:AtpZ/AtpI family protein [Deltaproteobacteria bacterium]